MTAGAPAERARASDAEEIVVGSRRRGRFAAGLGSVSHPRLEHADYPAVVVPQAAADHPRDVHDRSPSTAVVGYDGSPSAHAALADAARRAVDRGRVVAVHAFQPTSDSLGLVHDQRAFDAHQTAGSELLRSLEEQLNVDTALTTSVHGWSPSGA